MTKQICCLLFFISLSLSSVGQIFHRKEGQNRLIILSPGFSFQGSDMLFGEVNLMLANYNSGGPCNPPVISGPRIGIESHLKQNSKVYAPKIGYEISGSIICLRGNLINYNFNGKNDLRILPEIGLSLFGAVNLTYGYNIPITNYEIVNLSRNRFTLTFNLDFDLLSEF